jgi:transmembrane sensor
MNASTPHLNPAAEEQASLWAARLDGAVLSAEQRIALDAWLAADPAHRAVLSHYCQFSADLEQQLPLLAGIRELSAEVQPSLATARPHPWSRWPMMASVALTAAAAVALVFWLARPASQFENLATPVAQRRALTLADGTRVELNARTSLQVEIDGRRRHVRLVTGEAFFAVHKDPSRPFIVETPAGSVRVTGTQFNVRADSLTVLEVTVTEGSVQARPGDVGGQAAASVALTAGDKLAVRAGATPEVQTLSPTALANALAWRQGQAVFVSVPLREALACFARYHGRLITVTPDAANLPVGARVSLDDLDGFFATLQEALPVNVTRQPNGSVVVSRRTEH